MRPGMRRAAGVLAALVILLALGWGWGVVKNWSEIVSRPVRLAYIIADFGLVIPLGLVSAWGVWREKLWAPTLFAFAVGTLVFDTAHGIFYLIWDNYFHIPLAVGFLILAVLLAYAVAVLRSVHAERGSA